MQQCVGGSDVKAVRFLHPLGFGGGVENSSDATSCNFIKFRCRMAAPIFSPWWTFWWCKRKVLCRLLDSLVVCVRRVRHIDWKAKGAFGRHEQAWKNKTVWEYFSSCRFVIRKGVTLFESTINTYVEALISSSCNDLNSACSRLLLLILSRYSVWVRSSTHLRL
jgi:hypothetical protein